MALCRGSGPVPVEPQSRADRQDGAGGEERLSTTRTCLAWSFKTELRADPWCPAVHSVSPVLSSAWCRGESSRRGGGALRCAGHPVRPFRRASVSGELPEELRGQRAAGCPCAGSHLGGRVPGSRPAPGAGHRPWIRCLLRS